MQWLFTYMVGRLIGREYALFSSLIIDFGGVKKNKRAFHKFFVTLLCSKVSITIWNVDCRQTRSHKDVNINERYTNYTENIQDTSCHQHTLFGLTLLKQLKYFCYLVLLRCLLSLSLSYPIIHEFTSHTCIFL